MTVTITSLPPQDRPRERLHKQGVEALSAAELLALILRHGRQGENALDLSTALLAEYGSLARIGRARPEELAARCGIGPAKAASLVAAFRLGTLAAKLPDDLPRLASAADVAAVASIELGGLRRERVVVLICDNANRLQRTVVVSEGSIDQSLLPVRDVLNAVLRHDGRGFAIAHNHPSGDPTPSADDRRATRDIAAASQTVGLRFLDHVVVAGDKWSLASP
jgi:DNA repair protein RadC